MKRTSIVTLVVALVAAAAGCLHLFPPRINLEPLGTIGFIQFRSEAKGNIAEYVTQVFLEVLLKSQPGARIKELGREDDVLRDIGADRFTPDALETLRSRFKVDSVFLGTFEVSNIRPRVDLAAIITTLSVSADVDAVLTARLSISGTARRFGRTRRATANPSPK